MIALHRDPLVGTPRPDLGDGWLVNALDADVGSLPCVRRVQPADDCPLSGLVD